MTRLVLELDNDSRFTVDKYMECIYEAYEGADELFHFHATELNAKEYPKVHKKLVEYEESLGFEDTTSFGRFLIIMERLFEMYCILRNLP